MIRKLNQILPLVLGLLLAGAATAQSTPMPNAPAISAATVEASTAGMVWVTSPWGFTDLYFVHHGMNRLLCSGTGLLFNYYWPGF